MKKLVLLSAALACLTVTEIRAGTISMDFQVGVLADSSGTPITDGSLFQIIASPDTTFSAPTPTSFLGNSSNDVLVWSGGFDSSTVGAGPGIADMAVNNIDLSTYPIAGDYLTIRWFPTLTSSSLQPGASTSYGQYGYLNDNSWIAGNAGSSITYTFLTQSTGIGSATNSIGYANNTVTPVPEPSSSAIVIALCALAVTIHHRRRAVQAGR